MKVSILGGGNEVGATCLHVSLGNTNILIDAGMRMHGEQPLPALGMLETLGKPDAVLITHAHADHIGALPIVHTLFPEVPFYATPPTVDLMNIMLKDSYKILEQRSREMNTLMPYTEEQVNALLGALLTIPANGMLHIGDVKVTSFRAGHILGAVMFFIEGDGQQLLVTGDLSFRAGRTIPDAEVPHHLQPDAVIIESTYGNRAHTDRNTEERLLAEHVAEVVAGGGFALIPAFALGRAQEVLLVLQDYMEKGLIPEFPIYVDGLVTPVSKVYRSYPHYLKGPVAHRVRKHGDAFLTEGRCQAVSPKERNAVLSGKPGCIVASSGMLTGGASSWYAERLVSGEKNAIFITGYQDEESPGRKLLNIVEQKEKQLELNGTVYQVKCRIGKYGLSAHADANEIDRFIQSLKPTYTMLVHGDDEARGKLGDLLDERFGPMLVENGQVYSFEKRTSGRGIVGKRYRLNSDMLKLRESVGNVLLYRSDIENQYKLAICTGVHPKSNLLICQTLKGKQIRLSPVQVVESIGKWNRSIEELKKAAEEVFHFITPSLEKVDWGLLPDGNITLEDAYSVLQLISIKEKLAVALTMQHVPSEQRDGIKSYRLNQELKRKLVQLDVPVQGKQVNSAAAMTTVRRLLANNHHFVRCGVDDVGKKNERLTLYFDFPAAVSQPERKDIVKAIQKSTGWFVSISESVRQDLLQSYLVKLFGSAIGSVSIHLHEQKVAVSTEKPVNAEELVQLFQKQTGFQVQFKEERAVKAEIPGLFQVPAPKRLENNAAMEEAKKWARERGITIYKTSMKPFNGEMVMELHFISPEVAARHVVDMDELSYRIGMPVTFAKQPKQNEIIRITMESIPSTWTAVKNPSIHMDKKQVVLKLTEWPAAAEQESVSRNVEDQTGYMLEVTV